MKIYAIRDRIADELVGMHMYLLMCFRTHEQAARYFADAINDTTSILNKHPADYELIQVGELDRDTGNIRQLTPIQLIVTGDTVLALQKDTTELDERDAQGHMPKLRKEA